MSALIHELILDYALDRIRDPDNRVDLEQSIITVLRVCNEVERKYFIQYVYGYKPHEIALMYQSTTEHVEEVLLRIFEALEYHSGYTDTQFVRKISTIPRLRTIGVHKARSYCTNFSLKTHDIIEG